MAMVLVGATIVRSIETVWEGNITPPRGTLKQWTYPSEGDDAIVLDKGRRKWVAFKLGSTVVCFVW